jgi:hypothetical protein
VRQIGEQDVALMTGKTALALCFQAQAGLVIVKLLDFGVTLVIGRYPKTVTGAES